MHILTQVLTDNPKVRDSIEQLSETLGDNAAVQGLFLDVNPFWWHASCLASAGIDPDDISAWQRSLATESMFELVVGDPPQLSTQDYFRSYRHATSATGEIFGKRDHNDSPFLLKIIAKRQSDDKTRNEVLKLARSSPVPAIVQSRTLARLLAHSGDRIVTPKSAVGTLGGFLRDTKSNAVYAATCGHVIAAGESAAVAGSKIGSCAYSAPPTPFPPGTHCHARCLNQTRQDLALIGISQSVVGNQCTKLAGYVYTHQHVEMIRSNSVLIPYEVGGTAITHEIGGACWQGIYELRQRTGNGLLHPKLMQLAASPPRNGDSGAWVTDGADWCGMVVAADNSIGYALPNDQLLTEAKSAWGLSLNLA